MPSYKLGGVVETSDIVARSYARVRDGVRPAAGWVRAHLSLVVFILPIVLIAVALAAYGLWWRAVADGVRARVLAFQALQHSLGRDVTWDTFVVEGFPYRVDGTLNALHFTAPDRGSAFDGDRIVVHVQPLSLSRASLSFEGQQHYFYAREQWIETTARADKALVTISNRGNGAAHVDADLAQVTGNAKLNETDFNFIVAGASGTAQVRAAEGRDASSRIDVAAKLENIALQGKFDLPLGPAIQSIDIDAAAAIPANLPEPSFAALLSVWQQSGSPIHVKKFALDWGGVTVAASGTFKIDANALPDGRFTVTLGNHPRFLEVLEAQGWINAASHATAKKVLDLLAFMGGDRRQRVTVPLRIQAGNVYVGPVKIATLLPAPTASMQLTPPDAAAP